MANINIQRTLRPANFADSRREAALNWLALGLLLAAWNACDNDDPAKCDPGRKDCAAIPMSRCAPSAASCRAKGSQKIAIHKTVNVL